MQLLQAGLLLSSAVLTVHAADVICGAGRTRKVVTLKAGESANFYTSAPGTDYEKNVRCQAVFKRARRNQCDLNFSCEAFDLTAANAQCTRRSDFMTVSTIRRTRFCLDQGLGQDTSTNNGRLIVNFKSNRRSQGGPGAVCTATCLAPGATPPAPPATTPAPPATTPAPPATTPAPPATTPAPPATTPAPPATTPAPPATTPAPPATTSAAPPATTVAPTPVTSATTSTTTAGPSGTTIPNPGSSGATSTISIVQSWSQETDYSRTAEVKVPATQAGQKLPLVVDLHGNGGQGNVGRLSYLGDAVVIVAPNGYERSWNINNEASKADDVSFLLALIAKVTADFPATDSNDVTIIGTSNGAAMIYRLLIETGADRPFHRVLPMVSSLISVQWHDDQFWKNADYTTNDHSIPTNLEFSDTFEYAHFHGTNDGAIAYEGKSPGPGFLGANVDVIAAQKTDFLFARAMGYTGAQLADSAGVTIGTDFQQYSYLDGRVKHFKDIGGTHGSTFGNANTKAEVTKAILGTA